VYHAVSGRYEYLITLALLLEREPMAVRTPSVELNDEFLRDPEDVH
jgi:hypothetical protein